MSKEPFEDNVLQSLTNIKFIPKELNSLIVNHMRKGNKISGTV